jgi:RNA methyltransferase, TrmH family
MISKNKIKLIKSLAQKKYRLQEKLFLAEGNKITKEVLNSGFRIQTLICTEQFFNPTESVFSKPQELIVTTQDEIRKCSLLKNPQQALAICEIPNRLFSFESFKNKLTLCLDGIQDPGNLGTILRIADWFGINSICASENTADVFNPKVVQASMGAFLRVNVFYTTLVEIIRNANENYIPTFGTFLEGNNIYSEKLPESAMIIMGNEGQGISENLEQLIKYKIHIPAFNSNQGEVSESLNVSMATSIICSEFRRGQLKVYSK